VIGATRWKDIRKYRAGGHASAEERNVLGAALQAVEKGCRVVAFTRDRDGDVQRGKDVERGVATALQQHDSALFVAGGVAVEAIESWILSLRGQPGAEQLSNPKSRFNQAFRENEGEGTTAQMVRVVAGAELDQKTLPADGWSLRRWVAGARRAMFAGQDTLPGAPSG
jgi:hypothetical protein